MESFGGVFIWMTLGLVALIAVLSGAIWGVARLFGKRLGFVGMFFVVAAVIIALDRGAMWFMEHSAADDGPAQPPKREAPGLMAQ